MGKARGRRGATRSTKRAAVAAVADRLTCMSLAAVDTGRRARRMSGTHPDLAARPRGRKERGWTADESRPAAIIPELRPVVAPAP